MSKHARSKIPVASPPAAQKTMYRKRPFVDEAQTKQPSWGNSSNERPAALAPDRGFGERAVDRTPPLVVQPKLHLGPPNDAYEREADAVAARVVARLSGNATGLPPSVLRIRQLPPIGGISEVPAGVEAGIRQARSGGMPLAPRIRAPMERAFGADFSGVRIHTDAQSDRLNRSILSRAFVTGPDIYFERGAFDQHDRAGRFLLAHELVHVLQQAEAPSINDIPLGGANHYAAGIGTKAPSLVQLSRPDDIKKRAEQLWREKGGALLAPGSEQEIEIWLQAENDVDIARRAEEIWHKKGSPPHQHGSPEEIAIWLEAEKEVNEAAKLKTDNADHSPETKDLGKKKKNRRDKKVVPSVDPNNNNNNPFSFLSLFGGSTNSASTKTPVPISAGKTDPPPLIFLPHLAPGDVVDAIRTHRDRISKKLPTQEIKMTCESRYMSEEHDFIRDSLDSSGFGESYVCTTTNVYPEWVVHVHRRHSGQLIPEDASGVGASTVKLREKQKVKSTNPRLTNDEVKALGIESKATPPTKKWFEAWHKYCSLPPNPGKWRYRPSDDPKWAPT